MEFASQRIVSRTEKETERFRQSLRAVPVRNRGVRVLASENEAELHLEVSLTFGSALGVLRRLLRAPKTCCYILEGVGREVYEDIDDQRNFEQLIDRFAERHRLSFLESRALLAQYLQILTKKGLVVATMPRGELGITN